MTNNTNLEQPFKIEPSTTEKDVYVVYKNTKKRKNLDTYIPVAKFFKNDEFKLDIEYFSYPILSVEDINTIELLVNDFLEKL